MNLWYEVGRQILACLACFLDCGKVNETAGGNPRTHGETQKAQAFLQRRDSVEH